MVNKKKKYKTLFLYPTKLVLPSGASKKISLLKFATYLKGDNFYEKKTEKTHTSRKKK